MGWIRGFFEVDLDQVVTPELEDPNWQYNHHGRSRQEMERWIENLLEIQRLCREEGYDREDFLRMAQSQDPRERELAESNRHFYEPPDPERAIRLYWDPQQQQLEVENGRYRVWLAKQMGVRHLPAYVSAPDKVTLERLRLQGESVAGDERIRAYADWVPAWQRDRPHPYPDEPERQRWQRER